MTNGVLLVTLEFRWAFAIRFHKLGFCLSQFLHHLFIILFHLPCRLEFRLTLSNGEGVYPTALGYEMFPVSVQNVNHQGNDAKGLSSAYSLSKWSPLNPFNWIGSRLSESHLNHSDHIFSTFPSLFLPQNWYLFFTMTSERQVVKLFGW